MDLVERTSYTLQSGSCFTRRLQGLVNFMLKTSVLDYYSKNEGTLLKDFKIVLNDTTLAWRN